MSNDRSVSHLWGNEEGDPGDDNKKAGGEIVGDQIMREVTGQDHLKPSHTEVTQLPIVEKPRKCQNAFFSSNFLKVS